MPSGIVEAAASYAERMDRMYQRLIRDGAQESPRERERCRVNAPLGAWDPVDYQGDVTWMNPTTWPSNMGSTVTASVPGASAGVAVPTYNAVVEQTVAEVEDLDVPAPRQRLRGSRERTPSPDERRRDRFRDAIAVAREDARRADYTHESDKQWTNGELVRAAEAWEHARADLWPWPDKPFKVLGKGETQRLAKAVALLQSEVDRIWDVPGDPAGLDPRIPDLELEIQRLTHKGADSLMARAEGCDEVPDMDPF